MDSMELRAVESVGGIEAADIAPARELDDATYEPNVRVEQIGDYRQSEAIQADFTLVMENTAASAGSTDSVPKDEIRENIPPVMEGSGDRDTVLGGEPQVKDGPIMPGKAEKPAASKCDDSGNNKNDTGQDSGPILQGSEDRNTVLGREPQTTEGPFAKEGGEDAGGENITPINLPNIRNEGLPADGKIMPKADAGSGIKVDPVTGQVSGSIETSGEADSRTGVSYTMQEKTQRPGISPNTGQLGDVPPARINLSEGKGEPSHQPIGPGISDEPPTMKQHDGGTLEGSRAPLGPQELADQRFAEQALDALGYGMIGTKSGAKGAEVLGALGKSGKTNAVKKTGIDGKSHNKSSSDGGAPVHGYGPASRSEGPGTAGFEFKGTNAEGNSYSGRGDGKSAGSCKGTAERMLDVMKGEGGSGDGIIDCSDGSIIAIEWGSDGLSFWWFQNSIDGGNPMPYTGNWSAGKYRPGDPGTIDGADKENDSGKLMPVIRHGGAGDQGGGGNSTDDPSQWDDGNWYGGIFGSGGVFTDNGGPLPIDPLPHDKV